MDDDCKICSSYYCRKRALSTEATTIHIGSLKKLRELKECDKNAAKQDPEMCIACFDYVPKFMIHQSDTNELVVTSFSIYDVAKHSKHFYVQNENDNNSVDEACSFLLHFIEKNVCDGVSDFRFYCRQSNNHFVFPALVYASAKFEVKITLRYLERGHDQNEAIAVNSSVLRHCKREDFLTCEALRDFIALKNITVMIDNSIFDFQDLAAQLNWKFCEHWLRVKEFVTDGSEFPGKMKKKKIWDDPLTFCESVDFDVESYTLKKK